MGIEGESIGSVNVGPSIGPSIRGISSGIEGGFGARGGIAALEATVPLGRIGFSIVNEGPVAPEALNAMDIVAKPISPKILGEIVFKSSKPLVIQQAVVPSGTRQAEEVAAAAWEESKLPASPASRLGGPELQRGEPTSARVVSQAEAIISQVAVIPDVIPAWMPDHFTQPEPVSKLKIELSKIAPDSSVLTEVNKKVAQEQIVKEVLVEDKVLKQPKASEVEEIEELRFRYLLDEEVAEQRVDEIGKAIDQAAAEAKEEGIDAIEGWRIIKFLHLHERLISMIARKIRKDGSLDETVEDLVARKFASKQEAKNQSKEIVARKEPVRRGKEGKTVTEGAVERVFKHHFVKRSPTEEVTRRVKKKQGRQIGEKIESLRVQETRIEDYPDLAEVFKLAV